MKIVKTFVVIFVSFFLGMVVLFFQSPSFAEYCMSNLFEVKKHLWINSVLSDFEKQKYENFQKFTMKDNSWIIFAMSHNCCSGEGFDCVISKDNDGLVMIDKKKNFCGVESMCNEFSKIASDSKIEFYNQLKKIGLHLEKI